MARRHLIGLLLATEEDWPSAFEAILGRLGPSPVRGPDARAGGGADPQRAVRPALQPRYTLVIDRLSWWYDLPREWLKKIALLDDVYLLNNPFTFQAMEKHAAYCAMMRLGLQVPETWLLPHRLPPDNPRYVPMAERYNPEFDLGADRRLGRLPALHEALRRRHVGRRHPDRGAGATCTPPTTPRASA